MNQIPVIKDGDPVPLEAVNRQAAGKAWHDRYAHGFRALNGSELPAIKLRPWQADALKRIPPRWYLDAMREGYAPVCWEAATRWQKIKARVFYFCRF